MVSVADVKKIKTCARMNCLTSISILLGNILSHQFEIEKVVCLPKLKKKLLTVASIDNMDHNHTSNIAQQLFYRISTKISHNSSNETSAVKRNIQSLQSLQDPTNLIGCSFLNPCRKNTSI